MITIKLKTRFCPSPTGLLHLGNVRTALFAALLAKGQGGSFLLRIEDTDKARSSVEYTEALQTDMLWLGLAWDEGPKHDLGAGPYWQSQRQAIYDTYYEKLEAQGFTYPCFCSEEQLALARKLQRAAGKPPRYPGTCRNLTPEQIQEKLSKGLNPVLRFRVPPNEETVFHDLIRGEQRFKHQDIGDFIIRRTDGTPPFMYCNAIDDALMGVTHALRGEDHLTNTPRQLMILSALKLPAPLYGHIPLIVGSDGSPLSKRHGSRNVQELRQAGYLPIAILNYLGRLGHHYEHEKLLDMNELAAQFSLDRVGTAPARFDAAQLLHWQHLAVTQLTSQAFIDWMGAEISHLIPESVRKKFIETIRPNVTFPQDITRWISILFDDRWHHPESTQNFLQNVDSEYFKIAIKVIESSDLDYPTVIATLKEKTGLKGKSLFQPLRMALTGESEGPELAALFGLLGKQKILERLTACLTLAT